MKHKYEARPTSGLAPRVTTYIFKLIMKPHIIKKQGDGLNSYELGHSLVFFALFENLIMNTYI